MCPPWPLAGPVAMKGRQTVSKAGRQRGGKDLVAGSEPGRAAGGQGPCPGSSPLAKGAALDRPGSYGPFNTLQGLSCRGCQGPAQLPQWWPHLLWRLTIPLCTAAQPLQPPGLQGTSDRDSSRVLLFDTGGKHSPLDCASAARALLSQPTGSQMFSVVGHASLQGSMLAVHLTAYRYVVNMAHRMARNLEQAMPPKQSGRQGYTSLDSAIL